MLSATLLPLLLILVIMIGTAVAVYLVAFTAGYREGWASKQRQDLTTALAYLTDVEDSPAVRALVRVFKGEVTLGGLKKTNPYPRGVQ